MFKKKKSSGAKSNFNAKEFLIQHVEKIIFGVVAALAMGLVYLGFSAPTYPSSKTPEKLRQQATQVSNDLKKPHWDAMLAADKEGRNIKPEFTSKTLESRKEVEPGPYQVDITGVGAKSGGIRRGDPVLLAPQKLEVKYFYGPWARLADADPLEKSLEDAKKPEEKKPPKDKSPAGGGPSSKKGMGNPGGSAPSGYQSGGGGPQGMGGMMGGFGGVADAAGRRMLSPLYDLGFAFGMKTFNDPTATSTPTSEADAKKVKVAAARGFVVVTALAPHEELEANYKKEFADAEGFMEGRDNPVYQGIEVQRVEITDPTKEITEADWKPLPKSDKAEFKDYVKEFRDAANAWVGSCSEVHLADWTDPNISMPIPPILLTDYKKYASHSEIPTSSQPAENEPEADQGDVASGGSLGGSMGSMGSMGGMSMGSMGSMGMGGGAPKGYSGGSGAPSGYSGGAGGPPAGYSAGGGPGQKGKGMGMGMGSMGMGSMGMGGGMGGFGGPSSADAPKKLPSTKYKLVRFYDFLARPGKTYKYRVRLVMYDSNFPEYASLQPRSSTLNKAALTRVQPLITANAQDSKDPAAANKGVSTRVSRRESEWSAPSEAISTVKPAAVYTAEMTPSYSQAPNGEYYEVQSPKAESLFVAFEPSAALYLPYKNSAVRGWVFEMAKSPLEVIHPVTKIIKVFKKAEPTNAVTVVDIRGMVPLKMGNASRDPIKSGSEVVSFDSNSGQLIISREFDDFTGYHMFTQPDQPAIGPLGGGLKAESGIPGMGGGMGGAGATGEPGGMGMPGGGMPGGGKGKGGKGGGMGMGGGAAPGA